MQPAWRAFPRQSRRPRGVTLVELTAVIAIIALIAAVAVPRFLQSMAIQRLDAAARRFDADIRQMQAQARARGESQTLVVNTAGMSYTLNRGTPAALGATVSRVSLADAPYELASVAADFGGDAQLVFDGYGVPDSGGSLTLGLGGRTVTVAVDSQTGLPGPPTWN